MAESIFFGYPALPPRVPELMQTVAGRLGKRYDCLTWQDLDVDGHIVISEIFKAIDESAFCIFDVTKPNQNVLFEAGYATARAKPIWFGLDMTSEGARRSWDELGILKQVGYTPYRNSNDLVRRVEEEDPINRLQALYDTLIEPSMPNATGQNTLLYCPPFEPFEAANRLSALVDQRSSRGMQVVYADPTESSLNPVTWYTAQLASCMGVLINFAGTDRNRSSIHNLRNAFVAGVAVGLEIPVLMLAEEDYSPPFDYHDLLQVYDTAAGCTRRANDWFESLNPEVSRPSRARVRRSGLSGFRVGEHVAENEAAELYEYFIRTSAYEDVVAARDTLFVGHRGIGKTANAIQAFEELSENPNHLVLLIKPAGFEFPGLLAAIDRLPEHTHDYLFDTLWRFLIQTELANAALERIDRRPSYVPLSTAEQRFKDYLDGSTYFDVRADASVRLDQALTRLLNAHDVAEVTVESGRNLINEAFYAQPLAKLRHELGGVLSEKKRVAVLIDNLDKGWERHANLSVLARLILGLLVARGQLARDFSRQDWWRDKIRLTVAIFLRSDIFTYVKREAREPDKLSPSVITWRDPERLSSVLEERINCAWSGPGQAPSTWSDVFCPTVAGEETRNFLLRHIMPRPRDLVYVGNACLALASDRGRDQVSEQDVIDALELYSQYAYEALLVENGVTIPEMQQVLYTFLGEPAVMHESQIADSLSSIDSLKDKVGSVLTRLVEMSFLGIETETDEFTFPEVGSTLDRAFAMARRLRPDPGSVRFQVHPAFRPFLGCIS